MQGSGASNGDFGFGICQFDFWGGWKTPMWKDETEKEEEKMYLVTRIPYPVKLNFTY